MEQPIMKLIAFVSVAIGNRQYNMFAFFEDQLWHTHYYWKSSHKVKKDNAFLDGYVMQGYTNISIMLSFGFP